MGNINIDEVIAQMKQRDVEYEQEVKVYKTALAEKLGIPLNDAGQLLFNAFRYRSDEIALMGFDFLVDFFGYVIGVFGSVDAVCRFLIDETEVDTFIVGDDYERKYTLLQMNPKEQIGERIDNIMLLFGLTREQCVDIICRYPSWFFHTPQYLKRKVREFADYFEISQEKAATMMYERPFLLGKQITKINKKITEIANYYKVDSTKVRAFMVEYPGYIVWGLGELKKDKATAAVFDDLWLLNCMTGIEYAEYAGYRTVDNLKTVLRYIQEHFGKIEKLTAKNYKEGKAVVAVTKYGNKYCLVTLGGNLISEKARNRQAWFWRTFPSVEASARRNEEREYHTHKEYFCVIPSLEEEQLDKAIFLLAISGNFGGGMNLNKDSDLYNFSKTNFVDRNVSELVELANIEDKIKVGFCGVFFDAIGSTQIIQPPLKPPKDEDGDDSPEIEDLFSDEEIEKLFADVFDDDDD